ncbi:hypothetical protein ACQQ9Y_04760 [Atopobiaceae bacterium SGI.236]|nr:hypothetical protein [Atopobiaceae bacterium]
MLVQVLLKLIDDISGIKTEIARIRGEHALGITAFGDGGIIALLKGYKNLLA